MEDFLKILRDYFRSLKLTQQEIAERTNITQAQVSRLLSGRYKFGGDLAVRFASAFGINPMFLLAGDGDLLLSEPAPADAVPVYDVDFMAGFGELYDLPVVDSAAALIERHRGVTRLLATCERYSSARHFTAFCNDQLQRINLPALQGITLTMYWARHTWATIAAGLDIPTDTIAAALGNGSHTVTDIYIRRDASKVDEALRQVASKLPASYRGEQTKPRHNVHRGCYLLADGSHSTTSAAPSTSAMRCTVATVAVLWPCSILMMVPLSTFAASASARTVRPRCRRSWRNLAPMFCALMTKWQTFVGSIQAQSVPRQHRQAPFWATRRR